MSRTAPTPQQVAAALDAINAELKRQHAAPIVPHGTPPVVVAAIQWPDGPFQWAGAMQWLPRLAELGMTAQASDDGATLYLRRAT